MHLSRSVRWKKLTTVHINAFSSNVIGDIYWFKITAHQALSETEYALAYILCSMKE